MLYDFAVYFKITQIEKEQEEKIKTEQGKKDAIEKAKQLQRSLSYGN